MVLHELYRLAPWDDWISFDVIGVDRGTSLEDNLERTIKRLRRSSFKPCWDSETFEEALPRLNVLLADGEKQRIVVGLATDLVAALGPHVDGVDPRKRVRPVTELREDVRLFDGRFVRYQRSRP